MKVIRDNRGRFGQGTAPGPGRPRGSGPAAQLREHLGEARIKKLYDKLYELAEGGDVSAARVLLDRVLPTPDARIEELREAIDELRERLARRQA